MKIAFDPHKRDAVFVERGLRFEDAAVVFAGAVYSFDDMRRDYGERRVLSIGFLEGRMVVIGWTPRGDVRHVFTMRKANDREQEKYGPLLGT